ncbi:hypothetical protein BH23VER1_BH23VER1_32410 [soil metagenome]
MNPPLTPHLTAILGIVLILLAVPAILPAQERISGSQAEPSAAAPKWQDFDKTRITGVELDYGDGVLTLFFDGVPYVYKPGSSPARGVTTGTPSSFDARHYRVIECATLVGLLDRVRTIRVLTEPAESSEQPVQITALKLVMGV